MEFKKVAVIGGGVLGSQIAFQSAYCGFDVMVWELNEDTKKAAEEKLELLPKRYVDAIEFMDTPEGKYPTNWSLGISDKENFDKQECLDKVTAAPARIRITLDLQEAVKGANLVIEAIAEVVKIKKNFYKNLAPMLDEKTILASNSSTFLPSKFAKYSGRPEKFLALHFSNEIWRLNIAEIMGHKKTSEEACAIMMDFAEQIRMTPIRIRKEQPGYILNTISQWYLLAALDLVSRGVASPKDVDTDWKISTAATIGPLELVDIFGLGTPLHILERYEFLPPVKFKSVRFNVHAICEMLRKYMAEGKLGKMAGEGFYKYDEHGNIIG